jgi:hypothetical protein
VSEQKVHAVVDTLCKKAWCVLFSADAHMMTEWC